MLFIPYYFAAAENLRAQQTEGLSLVFSLESCMFVWYLHNENKPETHSSFTNGKKMVESSQNIGSLQGRHGNTINIINVRIKQIKWVTDPRFSSLNPPCISNIYAKENRWAWEHWVGLFFSFNFGFEVVKKLVGGKCELRRQQPASGESFYVSLQVAVGLNHPRLLVVTIG